MLRFRFDGTNKGVAVADEGCRACCAVGQPGIVGSSDTRTAKTKRGFGLRLPRPGEADLAGRSAISLLVAGRMVPATVARRLEMTGFRPPNICFMNANWLG